MKGGKIVNKKKARRRRTPRQRPDSLTGQTCPQCGSAVTLREIENFPVPVPDCQVDFHLKFCVYCGWNEGGLDIHSNRELSQAELGQIQASLQHRLETELTDYASFQQKLASMPMGLANTVIGAALGFDGADMSMVRQVARGISPEVAYGEICKQLAEFPLASVMFQALTDTPAGHAALLESLVRWRNIGYPPPWKDLVKGFLKEEK